MSSSSSLEPLEKKYNYHHTSVSVPINIPADPRQQFKIEGHIPFGPPVIHAEPERTKHVFENSHLYTDNAENTSFFRLDGNRIIPIINGCEVDLDNDVEMEE